MVNPDLPHDPRDDELAERGRLLVAEAARATYAPLTLRERLEADRARASTGRRRRLRLLAPAAGLVAATVVALVLALGGGASAPQVLAVAQLAARGPALPAPHEDAQRPQLLRAQVEGVSFPYWGDVFGWEASGARSDAVEGRSTKTVFYTARGNEAAYTIVAGDALEVPEGARMRVVARTKLWLLDRGTRRVVVWERHGHTCVMSAPRAVSEDKLLELAAWSGERES